MGGRMIIKVNTRNDSAESVDIHCMTTEFLIIMSALKQYAIEPLNHPDNVKLAASMINTDFIKVESEE